MRLLSKLSSVDIGYIYIYIYGSSRLRLHVKSQLIIIVPFKFSKNYLLHFLDSFLLKRKKNLGVFCFLSVNHIIDRRQTFIKAFEIQNNFQHEFQVRKKEYLKHKLQNKF